MDAMGCEIGHEGAFACESQRRPGKAQRLEPQQVAHSNPGLIGEREERRASRLRRHTAEKGERRAHESPLFCPSPSPPPFLKSSASSCLLT